MAKKNFERIVSVNNLKIGQVFQENSSKKVKNKELGSFPISTPLPSAATAEKNYPPLPTITLTKI